MSISNQHFKQSTHHDGITLSSDTSEHLFHMATTSFAKRTIPEDHLHILLSHKYVKEVLGGHAVTDRGHMKLMYEWE